MNTPCLTAGGRFENSASPQERTWRRTGLLLSSTLAMVLGACDPDAGAGVDAGVDGDEPDAGHQVTELALGDGIEDGCSCPGNDSVTGGQLGVVLPTPPDYPAGLQSVRFFVCNDALPDTEFRVRVSTYDAFPNTAALPGTELLAADVRATAPATGGWVDVDLSSHNISITEGELFVSMEWLTGTGPTCEDAQLLGAYEAEDANVQTWFTRGNHAWVKVVSANTGGGGSFNGMIHASVTTPL